MGQEMQAPYKKRGGRCISKELGRQRQGEGDLDGTSLKKRAISIHGVVGGTEENTKIKVSGT